jgi:integrase
MAARDARQPVVDIRRRPRADGSIEEIPTVRYYDAAGKRRRVTCRTVEEAEFECARMRLELSRGAVLEATEAEVRLPTLADFWPTWLADARGRLEVHTLRDYESRWARRIEPRFGDLALDGIRPRMVAAWRGEMQAEGVGREAIRKSMVLLQSMFTVAIEWGEATSNPVSVVRKPRQGRERAVRVVAPRQVEAIRRWMLDRGDVEGATIVSVLAYAGLRPGEMLALERCHVRDDTLLIEQAVADGRLKLQKTGRLYRTVDLIPALAEDLAGWIERLDPGRSHLFVRADGELLRTNDWNNWRKRHFYAAATAVGAGDPRPYDLRHSFASLRIREKELSIVELAAQLGHSPTETLKTYAHVYAEYRRQPARPAAELIEEARAGLVQGVQGPRSGPTSHGRSRTSRVR